MLGLGRINYPTLSDLVTENEAGWEQRFVQRLQVLIHEGLADRERVTHEGTKIRAAAGRGSFKWLNVARGPPRNAWSGSAGPRRNSSRRPTRARTKREGGGPCHRSGGAGDEAG